jgi:hypothetical protein
MECQVKLSVSVNGTQHELPFIPNSVEALFNQVVALSPNLYSFKVKYGGEFLSNDDSALMEVFLNHKTPELVFEVEDVVQPMNYMDTSVQSMYDEMFSQFKRLNVAEGAETLQLVNGVLVKEDLLRVLGEISAVIKQRNRESLPRFIEKRQEYFEVEEDKYEEMVQQQVQFTEMIALGSVSEVTSRYNITQKEYQASTIAYRSDRAIIEKMQHIAVETSMIHDSLPDELSRDKLLEVLNFSTQYLSRYIDSKSQMTPRDTMLLKFRENDFIMREYGYDEFVITAAMTKYNVDEDSYFEEFRNGLSTVFMKLASKGGVPNMGP